MSPARLVRGKHLPQQEGQGDRMEPVGAESHIPPTCGDSCRLLGTVPGREGRATEATEGRGQLPAATISPWAKGLSSLGLSFPRCSVTGLD